MKKIYIAGPMRGHECYNFEAFFVAAHILKQAGFEVINPAQVDTEKMFDGWQYTSDKYPDVILEDLQFVRTVDVIVLLDGWEESPGANVELAFAKALKIPSVSMELITEEVCAFPFNNQSGIIGTIINNAIIENYKVVNSEG